MSEIAECCDVVSLPIALVIFAVISQHVADASDDPSPMWTARSNSEESGTTYVIVSPLSRRYIADPHSSQELNIPLKGFSNIPRNLEQSKEYPDVLENVEEPLIEEYTNQDYKGVNSYPLPDRSDGTMLEQNHKTLEFADGINSRTDEFSIYPHPNLDEREKHNITQTDSGIQTREFERNNEYPVIPGTESDRIEFVTEIYPNEDSVVPKSHFPVTGKESDAGKLDRNNENEFTVLSVPRNSRDLEVHTGPYSNQDYPSEDVYPPHRENGDYLIPDQQNMDKTGLSDAGGDRTENSHTREYPDYEDIELNTYSPLSGREIHSRQYNGNSDFSELLQIEDGQSDETLSHKGANLWDANQHDVIIGTQSPPMIHGTNKTENYKTEYETSGQTENKERPTRNQREYSSDNVVFQTEKDLTLTEPEEENMTPAVHKDNLDTDEKDGLFVEDNGSGQISPDEPTDFEASGWDILPNAYEDSDHNIANDLVTVNPYSERSGFKPDPLNDDKQLNVFQSTHLTDVGTKHSDFEMVKQKEIKKGENSDLPQDYEDGIIFSGDGSGSGEHELQTYRQEVGVDLKKTLDRNYFSTSAQKQRTIQRPNIPNSKINQGSSGLHFETLATSNPFELNEGMHNEENEEKQHRADMDDPSTFVTISPYKWDGLAFDKSTKNSADKRSENMLPIKRESNIFRIPLITKAPPTTGTNIHFESRINEEESGDGDYHWAIGEPEGRKRLTGEDESSGYGSGNFETQDPLIFKRSGSGNVDKTFSKTEESPLAAEGMFIWKPAHETVKTKEASCEFKQNSDIPFNKYKNEGSGYIHAEALISSQPQIGNPELSLEDRTAAPSDIGPVIQRNQETEEEKKKIAEAPGVPMLFLIAPNAQDKGRGKAAPQSILVSEEYPLQPDEEDVDTDDSMDDVDSASTRLWRSRRRSRKRSRGEALVTALLESLRDTAVDLAGSKQLRKVRSKLKGF